MSVEETIKQRGELYGDFTKAARTMQQLKGMVRLHDNWNSLPSYQREAIDMILHKIGRHINGDHQYPDNFHDIGGYAKLAEDEILRNKND